MIGDVDLTLRVLLREALGVSEEAIRFERPDDRFVQSLSAPQTLCLYLYDIRENRELRRADRTIERRPDGTAEVRPPPLRFDLAYYVTAWAQYVAQEHDLLGRALAVLLANPVLEPEILQGNLRSQPLPLLLNVGQGDSLGDPSALWNGLGGVRPALFLNVTVPLNPFPSEERRLVTARLLRVSEKEPYQAALVETRPPEEFVEFAGKVLSARDGRPVPEAQVSLREVSRSSGVDQNGVYRIGRLAPGRYTLVVSAPGYKEIRRQMVLTDQAGVGRLTDAYDLRLELE